MIKTLNIRLISPAMIGGAQPRKLDPSHVLRPPSLRGMLRFWTRALAMGAGLNPAEEESKLWGSIDRGQGISLLPPSKFVQTASLRVLRKSPSHKEFSSDMFLPAASNIRLAFRLRGIDSANLDKFRAVIWTWLHLGTVGRRSRRGYGSFIWEPTTGDLLDGYDPLNPAVDLTNPVALEDYLRRGLKRVYAAWSAPSATASRTTYPAFTLASIDQIFVGQPFTHNGQVLTHIADPVGEIRHIMHGLYTGASGPREELGHAGRAPWLPIPKDPPRQASPVLWRLFPLTSGGFVPVMTWSPLTVTSIPSSTQVYRYLTGKLGFSNSLAGNPL